MTIKARPKLTFAAGVFASICYSSSATSAIPEPQQVALRAIFTEAQGTSWPANQQVGWSETGEVSCVADFIICDESENVTHLLLINERPVNAKLSSKISGLTELEAISLLGTEMTTALPSSMATLPKLKLLSIDGYGYQGPIPDWFGEFAALEELQIVGTSFEGPLPSSLGDLSTLKIMWIPANNNLDGPIPSSLGNLSQLQELVIAQNQLEGPIPESLGNLINLTMLNLANNKLVGDVPEAVYNLPNLDFSIDANFSNAGSVINNALFTSNSTTVSSPVYSQLTPIHQAHDAKITRIAYLGEDQASIEWQVFDWLLDTPVTEILDDGIGSHGYAIYTRVLNEDWRLVTTIDDSNIKTWQGSVPGLTTEQSVEIQVRRTIGTFQTNIETATRELAESSGTQAPPTFVDVSAVPNNTPSFSSQGDVLNNVAGRLIEIPAWASNLNDGDGDSQGLNFELKYLSNATLFNGTPQISVPSGTLRFNTNANVAGESLVVFELCDTPTDINQAQACSAQKVFKIGVDNATVAVPDFQVNANASTTLSELQEHVAWATGMHDGTGNASQFLLFEVLWIENAELFEINPWISTPSGSLHYQFKSDVSGQATVYVHFRDFTTGLVSGVKSFTLEKHLEETTPANSVPTANTSNIENATGQSSDRLSAQGSGGGGGGGGGSFGFLLLSLGIFRLGRYKV